MSEYEKIAEGHPYFERMNACREAKIWMCDAVNHNSSDGCENPECFKSRKNKYGWFGNDTWTPPEVVSEEKRKCISL